MNINSGDEYLSNQEKGKKTEGKVGRGKILNQTIINSTNKNWKTSFLQGCA